MTGKRVCILTGASGTLGRAFIEAYRHEYEIVAVYRRGRPWFPAQDAHIVDPLLGGRPDDANRDEIFALRADLRRPEAAPRIIETAMTRFGQVDLLVNAAVATVWSPALASTRLADSVGEQFALAVEAPLRLVHAAAEQGWQHDVDANRAASRNVVNVSSIAAVHTYLGSGQSVYAASKAAMNTISAHLAEELAVLGVRVNATAANSFPQIVSTDRAVQAIHRLDHSGENGVLTIIDRDGDRDVPLASYPPVYAG
jgi:NAD(P)-dependent dehydrogenase (short-subunit alcohol dehydrogenase family)